MKTTHLPTVTIGIAAYNEEAILPLLLETLIKQTQNQITIERILVISDGSSDQTVAKVLLVDDPRIDVIDSPKRMGKPARTNELMERSSSELFVLMDADLVIRDNEMIEKLLKPMLIDENVDLTSGDCSPITPITFAEKIANVSLEIWDKTKAATAHSEMYYCGGQLRAFRKRLYKEISFPSSSADDVFTFLFCMQTGFKFMFSKNAQVFFRLPATISDFIKQNKRFLKSKDIQENNFNSDFVKQFYIIGWKEKLSVLSVYYLQHPVITTCYLFFVIVIRVLLLVDTEGAEGTWSIVTSTKKLT